jgi:hypothetical protein
MSRILFSFLLVFYALAGFSQNAAVPASIQPPADSSKLIMHVYAKGVQLYVCTPDPRDSSHYVWIFAGPRANLFADSAYHQLVGKHYLGATKNPVWEDNDGSIVTGSKVRQADPPGGDAIPWLLLKTVATAGTGVLTPVVFIQRVNTKGGKAPVAASASDKGRMVAIAYTADYFFYGAK